MNRLSFLKSRLRTRSVGNSFSRLHSIFTRYGVGAQRFSASFLQLIELVKKYGVEPTFPLTASVLNRHPSFFHKIQEIGVELAVHGYKHIDYTQLNEKENLEHLRCATEVFQRYGIQYSGYRFPYLRRDENRIDLLEKSGFQWDSSEVISWGTLDMRVFPWKRWLDYQKIVNTYHVVNADKYLALPRMCNQLVEIPVSVPDDDILIDRLGLKDGNMMSHIWEKILGKVRERGEILVLQVHPERFRCYRNALENTLRLATEKGDVWTPNMREIACWWKEKERFYFNVEQVSGNRYKITAHCTDRATVLVKNGSAMDLSKKFFNSAFVINSREWEMESPVKPVIGIHPDTTVEVINFIRAEGFCYERSKRSDNYSVFINYREDFGESEKKQMVEFIEKTRYPLIRFWRWPGNAQFSFTVTGDIDGMDVWDFGERFYG